MTESFQFFGVQKYAMMNRKKELFISKINLYIQNERADSLRKSGALQ